MQLRIAELTDFCASSKHTSASRGSEAGGGEEYSLNSCLGNEGAIILAAPRADERAAGRKATSNDNRKWRVDGPLLVSPGHSAVGRFKSCLRETFTSSCRAKEWQSLPSTVDTLTCKEPLSIPVQHRCWLRDSSKVAWYYFCLASRSQCAVSACLFQQ